MWLKIDSSADCWLQVAYTVLVTQARSDDDDDDTVLMQRYHIWRVYLGDGKIYEELSAMPM